MKTFLQRYGVTIAWAVLLFGLSSISDLSFPIEVFSWDDKIQHLLAYMPLGWLLLRSIVWKKSASQRDWWLAILIGGLYGVSDEIHQYFVAGRFMDWSDAMADTIGVTLGGWIFLRWHQRRMRRQERTGVPTAAKKFSQIERN
jgi:VanZ family protein